MRMKQSFLLLARLLLIFIAAMTAFRCGAEKIDDTHYRFCIMDDATITDYDAVNSFVTILDGHWYSHNGVKMQGTETTLETKYYVTSMDILMLSTYDGSDPSLTHYWWTGANGSAYEMSTKVYITVQKPSGVSLKDIPSKALVGDVINSKSELEGTFPPFSGHGYFSYIYSSSDENVAIVSQDGKITAKNPGKATIEVSVIAKNSKYEDQLFPFHYRRIGNAIAEIEVVDNLDATDLSLSSRELTLDIGQHETIKAIITPEDARTTITWSSSDETVATVKNGLVEAVGRGNAAIEARTSEGLSAKCYVTVLDDQDYSGVCINGLYYDLNRKEHTAALVHATPDNINHSYVSGDIIVPEKVEYYGTEYIVTKIDDHAFYRCEIFSVKLPETITSIGVWAFSHSTLDDIELPQSLKEIGEAAFEMTDLESIIIGPNVSSLGGGAFMDCQKLKAVYVDEANPHFIIYKSNLYDAAKKKLYYVPIDNVTIEFPFGLETIGACSFYNNKKISSLQFPETLINIEDGAFSGCESLEKLCFPNTLMELGDFSFYGCDNLKEIKFGSKLKMIGEETFNTYTSSSLKIIRISALTPPTAYENSFADYGTTLVVPPGRVSVYKKDSVWGRFSTITDDEESDVVDVRSDDIFEKHYDVYDINGVLIMEGATKEDIRNFPTGVYIFKGNKLIIR